MVLTQIKDREIVKDFVLSFNPQALRIEYILYKTDREDIIIEVDEPDNPEFLVISEDRGDSYSFLYKHPEPVYEFIQKLFKEKNFLFFPALKEEILKFIEEICPEEKIVINNRCYMYALLDRNKFKAEQKHNVEKIRPEFVEYVHKRWPHGNGEDWSLEYIKWLLENQYTWAIYRNGIPVAFALQHGDGSMGILHTEPEFRRQGFATSINARMIDDLFDKGETPFCYIMRSNHASYTLAEKIGMERIDDVSWVGVSFEEGQQ
jgi:RimJ/RimL family protein N-acetyltransferase